MKLKSIKLQDFRGIKSLDLTLDEHLTLLTGANGAGKTTLLDAAAILLSWISARTRNIKGSGQKIADKHIRNTAQTTQISAVADIASNTINWHLVKTRAGRKISNTTDISALKPYISKLRDKITTLEAQCNIPLFAYYPVNRAVQEIPLNINPNQQFDLLDAWNGALTGAANFKSFFAWFRQREDLENENLSYLQTKNKPDGWEYPDRQLTAVRQTLSQFLPEFEDFKVRRRPLRMTAFKNGEELNLEQLSDGEKCMIALVGDLARRLAIANPAAQQAQHGEGIVLIDELDLHLHPMWQRRMIRLLPVVFKNCQFIVTTHSPQALSETHASQLRILQRDNDNQVNYSLPSQSYGLTTNEVLNELMLVKGANEAAGAGENQQLTRNAEVEQALANIFELIADEDIKAAHIEITKLESALNGDIPELIQAKISLAMIE